MILLLCFEVFLELLSPYLISFGFVRLFAIITFPYVIMVINCTLLFVIEAFVNFLHGILFILFHYSTVFFLKLCFPITSMFPSLHCADKHKLCLFPVTRSRNLSRYIFRFWRSSRYFYCVYVKF